ncbi:MAG: TlpA disulfide reductase family protein [Cellvibrio sp.]|uniref:TlpA family protein disulfide reductase n=1 Tax=Cellvibrio sp. TaxID=1965322 RepID=UPI0031ACFF60
MRTVLAALCFLCSIVVYAEPYNVGDIPHDLVGKTIDGAEVRVSDFKGKVVIVSFWASWCGPCMKELPILGGIQKSATPEKLQVISINYGESRKLFRKIADALSDTQMKLVSDVNKKTGRKYGVEGIPHMVIIDAYGNVAAVHIGYGESQLPALIDEINEIARR